MPLLDDIHRRLYCTLTVLFPAIWFLSRDLGDVVARVLILLFVAGIVFRTTWIRTDRMHLLCGGFFLLILLGYLWHLNSVPEELFGGSKARQYVPSACFFLLLAHGVGGLKKPNPYALLVSALFGFLAYLAVIAPGEHWLLGWAGRRVDFGIDNAQHAGIIFGTGFLVTLALTPRAVINSPRKLRLLVATGMAGLAALMAWGVLVTQSRAVWIGLALAVPVLLTMALLFAQGKAPVDFARRRAMTAKIMVVTAGLLTLAFVLTDAPSRIADRMTGEDVSVHRLASAARFEEGDALSSAQVRVASWAAAREWIAERPLMGWGAQTAKGLIEQSPHFSDAFKKNFGHLHNSYIEALVAIGWVGFLAIAAIVALIGWRAVTAWRKGWMPGDVFAFAWAFFVFWVIVNGFESYVVYDSGFFLNSVVGGFLYAFYVKGVQASDPATQGPATA
ncbi:O-antigen ligase family protein [Rhodocyclaceae bacterium SMB388]